MPIMPEKRLASIRQRMKEIVESRQYTAHEKRFRAVAQLERLVETVMECLPQEQQRCVQEVLSLYEGLWSSVGAPGGPKQLEDCRIHTRNSVIFRTVTLDQEDETAGTIELNDQSVRVFLVAETNGREWATTQSTALYLHAKWKGMSRS